MAQNDIASFPRKEARLVAAIDFGTSLSGFAYAIPKTSQHEKIVIEHYQCWNNGTKNRDIKKTATCILFDENQKFIAFGFEAQDKYAKSQRDGKHTSLFFFQNFKMNLYKRETLQTLKISDNCGKQMPAKIIFTESIRTLKEKLLVRLSVVGKETDVKEIRWVLTVPAIWSDEAKWLMRQCAVKAGIPTDQLFIALEPEAASVYCQHLKIVQTEIISGGFQATKPGTKYIVVDIGGGTTDITMHEKKMSYGLKELCPPHGEEVGGVAIDLQLLEMIKDLVGETIFKQLRTDKPTSYLDLYREFEQMKKSLSPETSGSLEVNFPFMAINNLCKKMFNKTFDLMAKYLSLKKYNLKIEEDKVMVDIKTAKEVIAPSIRKIEQTIKTFLEKDKDISVILLVGGLSENMYVQHEIRKRFSKYKVVVPEDAGLAVLKGAVLFGHDPEIINPRKTRYTYGVSICKAFDDNKHDYSKRFTDDWGNFLCSDCFSMIIEIDKSVPLGTVIKRTYNTVLKWQKKVTFKIYTSNDTSPLYVKEESCNKIGSFCIELPKPSDETQNIDIDFVFGGTELHIKATEQTCGRSIEVTLNL